MALMACSCTRQSLCLCRKASPWSRKMWATSRSEEPATAGLLQLGRLPVQPVQGTDHLSQSRGTDAGIQHRGFDTFMTEQLLDVGQLRAMLQKMSGEAVTQSVGGNAC